MNLDIFTCGRQIEVEITDHFEGEATPWACVYLHQPEQTISLYIDADKLTHLAKSWLSILEARDHEAEEAAETWHLCIGSGGLAYEVRAANRERAEAMLDRWEKDPIEVEWVRRYAAHR